MRNWKRIAMLVVILIAGLTLLVQIAAADPYGFYDVVLVSAKSPGMTDDGVEYDTYDIVGRGYAYNGSSVPDVATASWFKLFDGEDYGLNNNHPIAAFSTLYFEPVGGASADCEGCYTPDVILMSFDIANRHVPGITPKVQGQDIVAISPYNPVEATPGDFELVFDGQDVDLTKGTERIDGIDYWSPEMWQSADASLPYDCAEGIFFISTKGNYRVSSAYGPALVGDGSDVLLFCATNLGEHTAGFWFRGFDSSELPVKPVSAISGLDVADANFFGSCANDTIDMEDAELAFLFTARTSFTAGSAFGGPSEVFAYEPYDAFGPIDDLNDDEPSLNGAVTGFDVPFYVTISSDC